MGKIIPVANEKGGVGKTSTGLNLAYHLSAIVGKKVLLVDLDPQYNLTNKFFDSKEAIPPAICMKVGESNSLSLFDDPCYTKPYIINDNLHLLGTSAHISSANNCSSEEVVNFAENLNELAQAYDYVLIDCPPSVGNLQFSALTACHGVIIPTTADGDSIEAVDKVLTSVSKVKRTLNPDIQVLGILLNDIQKSATLIQNHLISKLRQSHANLVFESEILHTTLVLEASANKQSILEYDRKKAEYINVTAFMTEFETRAEELHHD